MDVRVGSSVGNFYMMVDVLPRARKMAASEAPGTPPSERVGWFLRCSSISVRF